jgi:hypothetical protein
VIGVEVVAGERVPRDLPAHPLAVGLDLLDRGLRHEDERGVARVEVGEVADVVGDHRAAVAARRRPAVYARREHEVVDDQLAAAVEQVEQARPATGPLEHIVLLDAHHWQAPALGGQRVTSASGLLLLRQQTLPSGLPLGLGHDLR